MGILGSFRMLKGCFRDSYRLLRVLCNDLGILIGS